MVAFKTFNPLVPPASVHDPTNTMNIIPGTTVPELIENWLSSLTNLEAPTPKDMCLIVAVARNIVVQRNIIDIISDGSLRKYIEKLSDYDSSAKRLAQAMFRHRNIKIIIEEVGT